MKRLIVPMLDGKLIADVSTDPDYPGIDVEFVSDKDNGTDLSRPRVLIEQAPEEGVRALIWNDPMSEDFTMEYKLLKLVSHTETVEVHEENALVVDVDEGTLIAKKDNDGILVELITGGTWDPKILVNQIGNKIQMLIWNKPYMNYNSERVILYSHEAQQSGISIRTLIQELQEIEKHHPEAVVKMHHPDGDGIMFAVAGKDGNVWLEGREDMDVIEELRSQYKHAAETQRDGVDFFSEMMERGFTLDDFREALSEKEFGYVKEFVEGHELLI